MPIRAAEAASFLLLGTGLLVAQRGLIVAGNAAEHSTDSN